MQTLPHTKPLEPKQRRFCDEYLKDLNATAAAKRAGYKPNNADNTGYKILALPAAQEYIQTRLDKIADKVMIANTLLLEQLFELSRTNMGELIDEQGDVKNLNEIPEHLLDAIQMQTKRVQVKGKVRTVTDCKVINKLKLLEYLYMRLGSTVNRPVYRSEVDFWPPEGRTWER